MSELDLLNKILNNVYTRRDKKEEYLYAKYLIFSRVLSDPDEWGSRNSPFDNKYYKLREFKPESIMDYHVLSRYYMMRILNANFDINYLRTYLERALESFVSLGDYSTLLSIMGYAAQYFVNENLVEEAFSILKKAKSIGGEERLPIIIQSLVEVIGRIAEKKSYERLLDDIPKYLSILEIRGRNSEKVYKQLAKKIIYSRNEEKLLEILNRVRISRRLKMKLLLLITEEARDHKVKLKAFRELIGELRTDHEEGLEQRIIKLVSSLYMILSEDDFQKIMNYLYSLSRISEELSYVEGIASLLEVLYYLVRDSKLHEDKLLRGIRLLDRFSQYEMLGILLSEIIKSLFNLGMVRKGRLLMDTATYFFELSRDFLRIYELYGYILSQLTKMNFLDEVRSLLSIIPEYPHVNKFLAVKLLYKPLIESIFENNRFNLLIDVESKISEFEVRHEHNLAALLRSLIAIKYVERGEINKAKELLERIFRYERGAGEGLKVLEKILSSVRDREIVRDIIDSVIRNVRDGDLLSRIALMLIENGFYDEAWSIANALRLYGGELGRIAKSLSDIAISMLRKEFSEKTLGLVVESINALERAGGYFNALNTVAYSLALMNNINQIINFLRLLITTDSSLRKVIWEET